MQQQGRKDKQHTRSKIEVVEVATNIRLHLTRFLASPGVVTIKSPCCRTLPTHDVDASDDDADDNEDNVENLNYSHNSTMEFRVQVR